MISNWTGRPGLFLDLEACCPLQDKELHPFHARRLLHVWDHELGVRVYQERNWDRVGNEL
jgi:hypothetical protein